MLQLHYVYPIMLPVAKHSVSCSQLLYLDIHYQTNLRNFHLVTAMPFEQEWCNSEISTLLNCESEFLHVVSESCECTE